MEENTQLQLLVELSKFFKSDEIFNDLKEAQLYSGLNDDTFKFIEQTILNRIDPIDWIKTNVKTTHPKYGVIPFSLYNFQEEVIKLFLSKHFVITLKSRQVGMSTLTQALCLWLAMNYQKYNILIISTSKDNAVEFLSKLRDMYMYLPEDKYKLKLAVDNKQFLKFSNGSQIRAVPATEKAARGSSMNFFVIDEAAFIDNIDDIYQSSYPTISRAFPNENDDNKKPYGIFIISTPYGTTGTGKWYYKMYSDALMGNNKYIPVRIHWTLIPEFDDAWYLDQCMQMGWDYKKIASELELSFVSSGDTFIPGTILNSMGTTIPVQKDLENKLWIWEPPDKEENYVFGIDVAYGDRKDSSVVQILKASTLDQVAEFESNSIIVDDFADVIIKLSSVYSNNIINIERNAVGKVLIEKILRKSGGGIGLNLYKDTTPGDLVKRNNVNKSDNEKIKIGTLVTGNNRDTLLSIMYNTVIDKYTEALSDIIEDGNDTAIARKKFEAVMNKKKVKDIIKKNGIVKSERLLSELLGFVRDEHGRASGDHDDLVMAWTHAIYCYTKCKSILTKGMKEASYKMLGYDKKEEKTKQIVQFMQRGDSKIWSNYSADDLAEIIEQTKSEDEQNNSENNKINNNDTDRLSKIYKAMYGN
jgi:hypothetical protein